MMKKTKLIGLDLNAAGMIPPYEKLEEPLKFYDAGTIVRPPDSFNISPKFDAQGRVQAFPGNTLIQFPRPVQKFTLFVKIIEKLREYRDRNNQPFIAPVDEDTAHITTIDLANSDNYAKLRDLYGLSADMTDSQLLTHFDQRIMSDVAPRILPPSVPLRFTPYKISVFVPPFPGPWVLTFKPADQATWNYIRDVRVPVVPIIPPDYPFTAHMTLGYTVRSFSKSEEFAEVQTLIRELQAIVDQYRTTLEFGPMHLWHFADMNDFRAEDIPKNSKFIFD